MPKVVLNALHLAKKFVQKALTKDGIAIDATAGNGYDTLFLAQLVGQDGQVYAFDIQEKAIQDTAAKLKQHGFYNVDLIKDGHQNMDQHIKGTVDAVMFNLGYMPGGDHALITQPENTVLGVKKALNLIKPAGIITIIVYTGHLGGLEEKEALEEMLFDLDQKDYELFEGNYPNQINNPPILYVIERRLKGGRV